MMLMPMLTLALLFQSPSPSSMRTIERGAASALESPRQAVARTAEEWSALWRAHAPTRPMPAVDFLREMVVGVFLGGRKTAGYSVEIVRTAERNGALVVQYVEKTPAPGMVTAQIITEPYHLVAMAQRAGAVRFEQVEK